MSGSSGAGRRGVPVILGMQVGTSAYGRPIPVAYGLNRIGLQTIWQPHQFWRGQHDDTGAGKGGGGDDTLNHFFQGVAMAICEGPITGLARIWRDKEVFATLADVNPSAPFSLFTGTRPQSPWSFLTGSVAKKGNYTGTVPGTAPYELTVPDPWFSDATIDAIFYTTTARIATGPYSWTDRITEHPLTVVSGTPGSGQAQIVSSTVKFNAAQANASIGIRYTVSVDITKWALGYGGTAYIASSSLDLGDSNSLKNFSAEVIGLLTSGAGGDVNPADVISDLLTNTVYGCGWDSGRIDVVNGPDGTAASGFQRYCGQEGMLMSPVLQEQKPALEHLRWLMDCSNAEMVRSEGKIKIYPLGDVATGTYAPCNTVRYALTNDHFLCSGDDDPVRITGKSNADALNICPVEYTEASPAIDPGTGAISDPADVYNASIVEEPESANVRQHGEKRDEVFEAHCITSRTVAQKISRLRAQKSVHIRNTYEFELAGTFAMLEPLDLVSLTETGIGLSALVVRIQSITRRSDGTLSITAQDWPFGVGSAVVPAREIPDSSGPDLSAWPGSANRPIIIAAPPGAVDSPEIWIGTGSPSKDWGGAEVHLSWDGTTYEHVGDVGKCIHGVLAGSLAPGAPLDTSNTLAVDLAASASQLTTVGAWARDGLVTACWVDGEILSFSDAALSSGSVYLLTSLRRGAYGTDVVSHPTDSSFLRLDGSEFRYRIPDGRSGQTLHVKLVSYNLSRTNAQSIADVPAYTFVVPALSMAPSVVTPPLRITLDAFDLADWEVVGTPAGTVTLEDGGVAGGRVLQATDGEVTLVYRRLIPVAVAKLYTMVARYQQTANPSSGTKKFSAGFVGVAEDGFTWVGKTGAATLADQPRLCTDIQHDPGGWYDFVGYWLGPAGPGTDAGSTPATAGGWYTDVRYVRPFVTLCGGSTGGSQQLDLLEVREGVEGAALVPGSITAPAFGTGVVDVGALASGAVDATKLAAAVKGDGTNPVTWLSANAIGTNHLVANAVTAGKILAGEIKTSNYAEDGSANPTAGAKLDHTGTALKVAPANLQIGSTVIENAWFGNMFAVCFSLTTTASGASRLSYYGGITVGVDGNYVAVTIPGAAYGDHVVTLASGVGTNGSYRLAGPTTCDSGGIARVAIYNGSTVLDVGSWPSASWQVVMLIVRAPWWL